MVATQPTLRLQVALIYMQMMVINRVPTAVLPADEEPHGYIYKIQLLLI